MVAYMHVPSLPIPVNRECNRVMKNVGDALDVAQKLTGVERRVFDFIKLHDYKVRISECAKELDVSDEDVKKVIKSLEEIGLLKVRTIL